MFQLTNIVKEFGHFTALKSIDLTIHKNQTTVVLGPSGSGKSTLLRCMNLLEIPSSGTMEVAGDKVSFPPTPSRAKQLAIRSHSAMVFQSFNLFPHLKALENVTLGPRAAGMPAAEADELATALLGRVGLADKAGSYPTQLSGGQQQRVAIARALAMRPDYLLCDEPTSALDPELEVEVIEVLNSLANQNTSMVVVTHNMSFARRTADRIIFLADGQIAFDGEPGAFFDGPTERIQKFLAIYTAT